MSKGILGIWNSIILKIGRDLLTGPFRFVDPVSRGLAGAQSGKVIADEDRDA